MDGSQNRRLASVDDNDPMGGISYPGVYVEEVGSRIHSISGVPTSGAAFVVEGIDDAGPKRSGLARAVTVRDYADFASALPGIGVAHAEPVARSVRSFFANGGSELHVVPVMPEASWGDQLSALDHVPGVGLLCLPGETGVQRLRDALAYADRRGLFLIVDPPGDDPDGAAALARSLAATGSANAAMFFPALRLAGEGGAHPPSAVVAGVYARTDRARGVWEAPAGVEARLIGVDGPAVQVDDDRIAALAAAGVNPIRELPDGGTVIWGARTVQGADGVPSEWTYVSMRRLVLFLEQTLDRGTRWAVFEPNDEPLRATLRSMVATFLNGLWRAGAFRGETPDEAYFVRCERMTQSDLDNGRLVIEVGVAPTRPAEFVIVRIGQWMRTESAPVTVVISGRDLGGRLRLPHRPVVSDGFQLAVGAGQGWTPWTLIEDLSVAGRDDRVYVLDASAGEVGFGDGEHGAMPPTDGATIRASYRPGSGSAGNVTGIGGIISQLKRKLDRVPGLRW
jgi:phage tail sheath protein FI